MAQGFGVKQVADVTLYNLQTGEPEIFLDSLKMSNLEGDAERSYAQGGKDNARILAFDYNRTANFTLQDALMNPKAMAMQAGTEIKSGVEQITKREVLTVVSGTPNTATTSETPSGDVTIYTTTDGYEHGQKEVVTPTGNDVDVADTEANQVIAYYTFDSSDSAETLTISSDKFSGFYKLVGDTVVRNADTNQDEAFQIVAPKIKIASNFSIQMQPDGEPAVFDMNVDVFRSSDSTEMVKMIRY